MNLTCKLKFISNGKFPPDGTNYKPTQFFN
jgi:hypothetical protein